MKMQEVLDRKDMSAEKGRQLDAAFATLTADKKDKRLSLKQKAYLASQVNEILLAKLILQYYVNSNQMTLFSSRVELKRTLTSPTMGTARPTRSTWTRSTRRGKDRGRMMTQRTKFRERGESSLRQDLEWRARLA